MFHRSRALIALALAATLTAGGFAAASAARTSRTRSTSERSGDRPSSAAAYLGVNLQDLSSDLKDSYGYDGNGVVVSNVMPGSPADKVGLEEGDIITRFNDVAVNSAEQLTGRVRALSPGTLASVSVWRDGKRIDLGRAELARLADQGNDESWAPRAHRAPRAPEAPEAMRMPDVPEAPDAPDAPEAPEAPHSHWEHMAPQLQALANLGRGRLGVETQDLDGGLGDYFNSPDGKGVLVLRVVEDTPANKAGLKAGDVILSVDGDDVADGDALRSALRGKPAGDVELKIRRKGADRTIHATLDKTETGHGFPGKGNGNGNWMGWMDDGNGPMIQSLRGMHGKDKGKIERRVIRMHIPDGGGTGEMRIDGMDDGDRDQLRKDLDELRRDLEQMRREMKNSR